MKVAVVGCGIAGASAAFLLAERGHAVTLLEQAPKCGPVGAGILLQPAGQDALAAMDLLDDVTERSSQIDALHAQHQTGRTLVHLDYARLRANCFGLGVHRGELFDMLLKRCRSGGVTIREGTPIGSYTEQSDGVVLRHQSGQEVDAYDVIIAADGSRSTLRNQAGLVRRIVEYPYAALWMTGPWSGDDTRLLQVVGRDGRLIGILPIGHGRASFFWGLWRHERESVWNAGLSAWVDQARRFYPDCAEVVESVSSMDDVTFATYRNVQSRRSHAGRVVFIGDAAHATSPHLGQGTNLALADAWCLAQCLSEDRPLAVSLMRYERERRAIVDYYTRLTAMLTPFFQTDNRVLQFGRDLALPLMPRLPFVGREMLRTLAGEKGGWLA